MPLQKYTNTLDISAVPRVVFSRTPHYGSGWGVFRGTYARVINTTHEIRSFLFFAFFSAADDISI